VRESDKESKLVEQLIRQLVGLLGEQNETHEGRNGFIPEEIILDRTVGAVRYLLIRMPSAKQCHAPLSPREHEVVRMVADGHPTKVIADVLNISCWTVTAHLRRIFMKLGVTSRPAMVARLLEEGRSRDVRAQAEKPPIDTKTFVDTSTNGAIDGTQSHPRSCEATGSHTARLSVQGALSAARIRRGLRALSVYLALGLHSGSEQGPFSFLGL
jgi:DNA-binding CsgD family transcriptional regulator